MNKYRLSFLLSIITVLVIFLVYGLFLENSEKPCAAIFYGNIASPPTNAWFMENWLLQLPIIVFLGTHFEKVPVYGIWHIIVVLIRLTVWFQLARRMLSRLINNRLIAFLTAFLLVLAITGTTLIYVYQLRDAILLASGTLLLYLDYYIYDNKKPKHLILLFFFAGLIRISIVLIVLVPLTLLVAFYFKSIVKVFQALRFQWLSALICLLIVEGYKLIEKNPGAKIESRYEYALGDRDAILPLSTMKTRPDTVRYQALTGYFMITDSAQISTDFIARCLDPMKYMYFGITRDDVQHFIDKGLSVIENHKTSILLFYLLLAIALWGGSWKTVADIIVLNILSWAVVLLIGFKINIFEYFFVPWLSLPIGGSFWLISMRGKPLRTIQKSVIFILIACIAVIEVRNLKGISVEELQYQQRSDEQLKSLAALSENCEPVLWDFDHTYLPNGLFERNEADCLRKCLFINLAFLNYYSWSQKQCLQQFGFNPLDWKNMALAFKKHRESICFVMSDDFARFLPYYFKELYGIDFKLVKSTPAYEVIPGNYVFYIDADKTR